VYAADGPVVVVSATGGVEVGTEKVWDYCEKREIPRLFLRVADGQGARRLRRRCTPRSKSASPPR